MAFSVSIGETILYVIGVVMTIVVTLNMLPTLKYYVGWINATTLSGVPLASVLVLVAPYGLFFFVLGIALLLFKSRGD